MRSATAFLPPGRRVGYTILFYGFVAGVLAVYLFPFYWMVLSSLKSQIQSLETPPLFLFKPTIANYRSVFEENPFFLFLRNSMIVGLGSTLIGLLFGLPAAYAIARFRHRRVALAVLIARITRGSAISSPGSSCSRK